MIERYSITSSAEQLRERFAVDVPEFYQPSFNASPTHLLPVITTTSPEGVSLFYWGETPKWAKNKTPGEKIINVRIETLPEKTALRKSLMKARCIIPADGFYAWKKVGKKTSVPYRFVLTNNELFSFAALWEEFEDDEGTNLHTFTILTMPSIEPVSLVQDRMPVILDKSTEGEWLGQSADEAKLMAMLLPNPNLKLNYYPVSPRINDHTLNVPSLITPTPPVDQFGNLTLFD